MSTKASPASRRAMASWRWWCVSFGLRPITYTTPRAFARSRPRWCGFGNHTPKSLTKNRCAFVIWRRVS
jgi:hypothetical protein